MNIYIYIYSVCSTHIFEFGSATWLPTSSARHRAYSNSLNPQAHWPTLLPRATMHTGREAQASHTVYASNSSKPESIKAHA